MSACGKEIENKATVTYEYKVNPADNPKLKTVEADAKNFIEDPARYTRGYCLKLINLEELKL